MPIVAAVGLVLVSPAGHCGDGKQASTSLQHPASGQSAPIQNALKPNSSEQNCSPGTYHRNSALCAEWKAADAAQQAADAASTTVTISWISLAITVATMAAAVTAALYARCLFRDQKLATEATRKQVVAAERQAKAAEATMEVTRDIGKKQTRPYLILDTKNIEIAVGQNGISNVFIRVPMKNYGTTPAVDPNIACNCRLYLKEGMGASYVWSKPLIRTEEIGTTIEPNSKYRGVWRDSVIDSKLTGDLWQYDRPQFSLSAMLENPDSYPVGFMADILFTYLDLAGEVQASEYYRLDARIEKRDQFSKAQVLRVRYDPQGAGDIYPMG